jgi:trk system potassium uptake protein TrkA
VLIEAGAEKADAFAAVSSGDNSNIISARVARETFGVERVVARSTTPSAPRSTSGWASRRWPTVPWSTDRLMRMLLPDGVASAWREPNGTVAILPLPLHEDWVGHSVRALELAAGCRVAFIVRFGTGVLPGSDTVVQAEDTCTSPRCPARSAT